MPEDNEQPFMTREAAEEYLENVGLTFTLEHDEECRCGKCPGKPPPPPYMTLTLRNEGERLLLLKSVRREQQRLMQSKGPSSAALERCIHLERKLKKPKK